MTSRSGLIVSSLHTAVDWRNSNYLRSDVVGRVCVCARVGASVSARGRRRRSNDTNDARGKISDFNNDSIHAVRDVFASAMRIYHRFYWNHCFRFPHFTSSSDALNAGSQMILRALPP